MFGNFDNICTFDKNQTKINAKWYISQYQNQSQQIIIHESYSSRYLYEFLVMPYWLTNDVERIHEGLNKTIAF